LLEQCCRGPLLHALVLPEAASFSAARSICPLTTDCSYPYTHFRELKLALRCEMVVDLPGAGISRNGFILRHDPYRFAEDRCQSQICRHSSQVESSPVGPPEPLVTLLRFLHVGEHHRRVGPLSFSVHTAKHCRITSRSCASTSRLPIERQTDIE